ncbi:MAG: DUF2987 domain-containing protein [Aeromonadales bacterium]|nr:DUF2987 domain-containing protein [Aeromonadales bacterium]
MKISIPALLLATLTSFTLSAQTTELDLDYSNFYKYMKKVKKAELEYADLGFYLARSDGQGLCNIESGYIELDEQHKGEVSVLAHGQFVLPYDNDLSLDKALVKLTLSEPQLCDMSVQIQANLDGGDISLTTLRAVEAELYQLLQKMAGWPGKYFTPELQGIKLHNADPTQLINGQSQMKLSTAELAENSSMTLPAVRITPWF